VRGDGGVLLNNKGERFMFNYIPERFAPETADTAEEAQRWLDGDKEARRPPELLTRDVVARAIVAEVKAGRGSDHGGALLDIASRRPAEFIKKKLPSMYHQFKELAEVDITAQPMEVGPTLHYYMGGIRVDSDTQMTNVPGVFACGECTAGLHGANRLGGNSLSDLLVMGKLSGDGAAEYVKRLATAPQVSEDLVVAVMRRATDILNRESGTNPYLVHEDLQQVMERCVGIVRTEAELLEGLEELARIKADAAQVKAHAASQYNPGWHEALDLRNLLISAEATTRAALMREESRGAHTRLDFEGERDEWLRYNVVIRKGADGMEVEKVERPAAPADLAAIANASLEELEASGG
jgi:succinate dehydrogenase / fumarate reductase flavoprotein subunit